MSISSLIRLPIPVLLTILMLPSFVSLFILPEGTSFGVNAWVPALRVLRSGNFRLYANEDDVEALRTQASKLREEIAAFEGSKAELQRTIEATKQRELQALEAQKERYSADVPILKADGSTEEERIFFPPLYKGDTSFITVVEAPLPLGMLLGEDKVIIVDEVASESNAEKAGIQEGDLIRACSACKMEMTMPTWQVIAGGIGIPKTRRFMYQVDGKPLEEVMAAIASNRQDPEARPVLLVVERMPQSAGTAGNNE